MLSKRWKRWQWRTRRGVRDGDLLSTFPDPTLDGTTDRAMIHSVPRRRGGRLYREDGWVAIVGLIGPMATACEDMIEKGFCPTARYKGIRS